MPRAARARLPARASRPAGLGLHRAGRQVLRLRAADRGTGPGPASSAGRPAGSASRRAVGPPRCSAIVRAVGVWLVVPLGLALAVLGLASALNWLSLRDLLIGLDLWGAFLLAEQVHAMLRPRTVQGLELGSGLVGLAVAGGAVWRLARRGRPRRRAR